MDGDDDALAALPSGARWPLDGGSQLSVHMLLLQDTGHLVQQHQSGAPALASGALLLSAEDASARVPGGDLRARQETCCSSACDASSQALKPADLEPPTSKDSAQRGRQPSRSRTAVAPLPSRPSAAASSQCDAVQPPLVLRGWPLYSHLKRDRRSNSGSGDADESDLSDDDDDGSGEAARAKKSSRLSTTEWRASARADAKRGVATSARPGEAICASAVAPLTVGLSNQIVDKPPPPLAGDAATGTKSSKAGNKTSRYLREMDRRDIITRIDQGEKQAALAKEYNISRSAVCNLHKKRQQVLARAHASPFAKHPKVSRVVAARAAAFPLEDAASAFAPASAFAKHALAASSLSDAALALSDAKYDSGFHLLTSRAAELLLRSVLDPATQASDFRRYSDRLMRLVLEEALALAQIRPLAASLVHGVSPFAGATAHRPVCAISMEQRACPMLEHFNLLEPLSPSGYARFSQNTMTEGVRDRVSEGKQQQLAVNFLQAHLPANLALHDVLLLESVVENGDAVCLAIDEVLRLSALAGDDGLAEHKAQIAVATLFVSSEAVETIMRRHPHVRVVSADCELQCVARAAAFRTRFEHETTRR